MSSAYVNVLVGCWFRVLWAGIWRPSWSAKFGRIKRILMRMNVSKAPSRLPTGVPGLDEVLLGGLPQAHTYLVEGHAGTGKTTLALQFVIEGARAGERCLYVTLSETKAELEEAAQSHNWSLDGISIAEFVPD